MAGIESDPGDFARTMDIRYDDDLGVQAAEVRDLRSQVEAEEAELAQKTTTVARALRGRGMSVRDIGTMTGLSHQRVQQLVQGQGAH
jgi:DNA-directed RNA polymerase specialized sigma subunit